jgi:hypothetical protein
MVIKAVLRTHNHGSQKIEDLFQNQELDNTSDDDPTLHVCCCASSACVCVCVCVCGVGFEPLESLKTMQYMLLESNATQPWRSCLFLQPKK